MPRQLHLILGATGQLGHELGRVLGRGRSVISLSRPDVDLLRPKSVIDALRQYRPRVIWNAAAATAVDVLEGDPELAHRVNASAVGILADTAKALGAVLVHFSTDYVFDGTKTGPYLEEDVPNPLNVYGASKLAGERAVQEVGGHWFILRTSWLYSIRRKNFLRNITLKGLNEERLAVVTDQVGAPTQALQVAEACAALCTVAFDREELEDVYGLYHLAASGSTSWWGFACAIRDELVARGVRWKAVIDPITSADLCLPARRPANSCLHTGRFSRAFKVQMMDWRDALAALPRGSEPWLEPSAVIPPN